MIAARTTCCLSTRFLLDEYIQKVHLPAAQAIHAVGGKVVYGGWPDATLPGPLLSLLDANSAWNSIDALDIHYFNVGDVQTLRSGADSRGYTNLPIWQTEIGFTSDYTFIPNYFARALCWNLTNNWTRDKYHVFYFANWAPNDPRAYGYNDCLWSGSALNGSGQVLTNLANVLGGTNQLRPFPGVTSTPALYPQVWPSTSALESFNYLTNLALVVSLTRADYTNNPQITLYLPVAPDEIASAARVDLTGVTSNIKGTSSTLGWGSQLTVSTRDVPGSLAETWNAGSSSPVFYVLVGTATTNLELNRPVTASSTETPSYPASNAVDGNLATRWSSAYSDPQWIAVDLGATYNLSRVKLYWEAAYAKSYQIQVSPDALSWTTIYSTSSGSGGINDLSALSGSGRYVRVYGTQRGTIYGYSLYELQVFGTHKPPVLRLIPAANALSLSWPAGGGFIPWTATNLTAPIFWAPATNSIQGTDPLSVTITPSGRCQFFQLRSP